MNKVIVEWNDSSIDDLGWRGMDGQFEVAHCTTLGFMLEKDKDEVVVVQSFSPNIKRMMNIIVIPMGCVTKIKEIK